MKQRVFTSESDALEIWWGRRGCLILAVRGERDWERGERFDGDGPQKKIFINETTLNRKLKSIEKRARCLIVAVRRERDGKRGE